MLSRTDLYIQGLLPKKTFTQVKAITTNANNELCDLRTFWKNYSILIVVHNIGEAWKEIKNSALLGVWHKHYSENDRDITTFEETEQEVKNEIVKLADHVVILLDIETEHISECIESNK